MQQKIGSILSQCDLFAHVGIARRERLAQFSTLCRFSKGQRIFRQGDACPGIYVVDRGIVRVFKTGNRGKEHVLHMIGPGHTFAEVAAIGNFECPAHAESVADTVCALVPLDPFQHEMQHDHQLCLEMMTGLSLWVRRLISLMEDIVLRDALGRTARFLLESDTDPDGTVRLPSLKRHVASHLNLTSETFSRTLGRLIEAGLIVELDDQRLALPQREKLQAISEGVFPAL